MTGREMDPPSQKFLDLPLLIVISICQIGKREKNRSTEAKKEKWKKAKIGKYKVTQSLYYVKCCHSSVLR